MFKLNGEKTCQGISGKRTAFGSGSKTCRRLICDEHAHGTQLTRTVHDLAMDRIFKRPFRWPELYRSPGRVVNSFSARCCTKVIMSGVNDKVIMSGCGDD